MNPNSGTTFIGNIYQGTLGITINSGMTSINPQLGLNTDGYYSLLSNSPAINSANSNYPSILDIPNIDDDPFLLFDIGGQQRPNSSNTKDIGCDEYSTGTNINHPLLVSEVGPSYLGGPCKNLTVSN
jgi:hypothetical protein